MLLLEKKKKTKPLLFIFPHLYPCQYAFWGAELQYQGLTWVGWWMQAHCIIFGKVWWQQRCLHMISEILLYLSNLSIMYLLVSLTLYMMVTLKMPVFINSFHDDLFSDYK